MKNCTGLNPSAKKGIEPGQILRIPVITSPVQNEINETTSSDIQEMPEKPLADNFKKRTDYFYHQLESGETLFDLEKKYGLPKDSLLAMNPILEKGILPGVKIRVPASQLPVILSEPVNETNLSGIQSKLMKIFTMWQRPIV